MSVKSAIKNVVSNKVASSTVRAISERILGRHTTILMLHRFQDFSSKIYADHDAESLRVLLEEIRRLRIPVVSVDQIFQAKRGLADIPNNAVAFTMDDGFLDQLEVGAELFIKYDCPAVIFGITDFIDTDYWLIDSKLEYTCKSTQIDKLHFTVDGISKTLDFTDEDTRYLAFEWLVDRIRSFPLHVALSHVERFAALSEVDLPEKPPSQYRSISWAEARKFETDQITIGAHTMTHPILSAENDVRAKQEIEGSILRVQQELNHPSKVFCYPTGRYQDFLERDQKIVAATECIGAVNAEPGYINTQSNQDGLMYNGNRFSLPDGVNDLRHYILKSQYFFEKLSL